MKILAYDFETFFSNDYTLSKSSPAEYILDYRYECLGCGFKWLGEPAFYIDGPQVKSFVDTIDWEDVYAVAHNALFDACIMRWRYGVNPRKWGDTIAMARNWWAYQTGGTSLAELSRFVGLPPKMDTTNRTRGKGWDAICCDPELLSELRQYGADDTEKCMILFLRMLEEGFPVGQLDIIDRQIRMATDPQFVVDHEILAEYHGEILAQKADLLARAGLTSPAGVMSDALLAALLMAHGLEHVPMKISKKTGKESYAFAKTDEEFTDLLDHPSPMIQALVGARLGHKTTIEETRTARFMQIGNLPWPDWCPPNSLPVPLKYSGARTHRFSGDWKLNAQNLGRKSKLRLALKAPQGKLVVSVDASQIEARLNGALARMRALQLKRPHSTLLEQFARGDDVYSVFAAQIYGKPINKDDNPTERFIGKTGVLSLGYGASWVPFQAMCRIQSDGTVFLTDAQSAMIVQVYRTTYMEIPALWGEAETLIGFIASAKEGQWLQFGPVWVGREVIVLPNGNRLNYRDLHQERDEDTGRWRWYYYFGRRKLLLYGSKLVENIIQALAFVHIMEADQRIVKLTHNMISLAHQVHDELIYIVPARNAEAVKEIAKREIARAPSWMPWVPMGASGGIGTSYGAAK